ncbi:hypothetical protein JNK13_02440 [bacterium]|nr:hypothetical protein [bacterium]
MANSYRMKELPCDHEATLPHPHDDRDALTAQPRTSRFARDEEHYQLIAKVLLACEINSWTIGIPWTFLRPEIKSLNSQYQPPVEEFLREALCVVHTRVLQSYAEDLETLPFDQQGARQLGVEISSFWGRYLSPVIGALVVLLLAAMATYTASSRIYLALFIAFLSGAVVFWILQLRVGDFSRRRSFHTLLCKEILRRQGLDTGPFRGIRMFT